MICIIEKAGEEWTALHVAAKYGNSEAVVELRKSSVDIHATETRVRWAAIHHSAKNGDPDTMRALLASGADTWQKDKQVR